METWIPCIIIAGCNILFVLWCIIDRMRQYIKYLNERMSELEKFRFKDYK